MIDTKELRRLAQAAAAGPWKSGQYLGSLRQFVIHTDVGDKGRGSDVAFTSAAFGNDETVANARFIAAANPATISELLDRLETAETAWKEAGKACRDLTEKVIPNLRESLEAAEKERDAAELISLALRAKIEAMEKQEPVAWRWELKAGQYTYIDKPEHAGKKARIVPLYALHGAKGEEK